MKASRDVSRARRARAPVSLLSALLVLFALSSTPSGAGQETAPAGARSSPGITPVDRLAQERLEDPSPRARGERRQALIAIEAVSDRQHEPRREAARISLSLKDADLQEVLRSFARIADVNLVLDPGIEGKVNLELHDVPWDRALMVILKSHRLSAQLDGRIWRVD